ncbi:MAG TPA: 50S ribosomal protein L15 [Candidatus Wolfebacteria bacterium]|nr:50S ribosomal protein L15 [Candidatus Wolfebacteria bacterium]
MQLHQLKPKTKSKNKKRIGRGGKRGTYSGRGIKGQKSRAGHKIRPAERDLIQRLPKLRGIKNKPLKSKPVVVNFSDLEKKIKGNIINRDVLLKAGLIRKSDKRVKILGPKSGKIKRTFQIEGLEVSKKLKHEQSNFS